MHSEATDAPLPVDEFLYSRQLYVIGNEAMRSISGSSVLLFGMGGLGAEIAKNLVLVGVKHISIWDSTPVSTTDVGSNYLISPRDIPGKKTRAEVCCSRLQEMNPNVSVSILTQNLSNSVEFDFLRNYHCVIMTETDLELQIKVDRYCRMQDLAIPFIAADVFGVYAAMFCDFGTSFAVLDANGEETKEVLIGNITKAEQGVVSTLQEQCHGLETGGRVVFHEVIGMDALNGCARVIRVLSPTTFEIGDTSDRNLGIYQGGGYCRQLKKQLIMSFEPLATQVHNPRLVVVDFMKPEAPKNTHLAIMALHAFSRQHGRLPFPWCGNDALLLYQIAADLNINLHSPLESVDQSIIQHISYTAQGQLPCLTAFLGGVVSQEVIKGLTRKFTPLNQWLYLDAREVAGDCCMEPLDSIIQKDRYDSLRICLGSEVCRNLSDSSVFMVGCGAIGCEMLKNCAMLGIGTAEGLMTVTDDDIIEKSNLSRQFLFRSSHIRQSKSIIASSAVQNINPDMKIQAHQFRVGPGAEKNYTDEFFAAQTVVVNALDNIEARRYIDRRCVQNCRPLLDSGTMGCKGHVQVVFPHLTECYSDQADPQDEDYPYCTIKSFPYQIEHTVQWARDKFESLFYTKPAIYHQFWECYGPVSNVAEKVRNGEQLEGMAVVVKLFYSRPHNWADCIKLARLKFEKYFNHKPRQLLHIYPLDTTLEDGSSFWQSPKRPPHPIQFSLNEKMHLMFVVSMAKLLASVWRIHITKEDTKEDCVAHIIHGFKVPEFQPDPNKVVITDENVKKTDPKPTTLSVDVDVFHVLNSSSIDFASDLQLIPQQFDKDDETKGHIDFLTAATNLRAVVYKIEPVINATVRKIAGNIIPAIATTTSAVAGLMAVELLKIVKGVKKRDNFRNCFLNLALPSFVFSEPAPPVRTVLTQQLSFTVWDRWLLHGKPEMTVQNFLDEIKKTYEVVVSMVVEGSKIVWLPLMPGRAQRLSKRLAALLKPQLGRPYTELTVVVETPDGGECVGPPVRYYYGI